MPNASSPVIDEAVVAVLLAGGRSRRMGQDKATALLGGRPLGHWAAAALAAASLHRVQLGGAPLPGLRWQLLADRRPGCGPAAAIETALSHFPGCATVVCAVDCPFVAPGLLRAALRHLGPRHLAAIPHFQGRWHGLVGAYSPAVLPALQNWLDSGQFGLQRFLQQTPVWRIDSAELAAYGDPETLLCNVNSPTDLQTAEAMLAQIDHL